VAGWWLPGPALVDARVAVHAAVLTVASKPITASIPRRLMIARIVPPA
jgi:hypothetical protein